jgi:predicted ATPase/DNA-binding XRE family transcriptional regulator
MVNSERLAFGRLLHQHRSAARLTQEVLAERAGLGVRSIQRLENGGSAPYQDTVRRLIAALELVGEDCATFEAAAKVSMRSRRSAAVLREGNNHTRNLLPSSPTSFIGREREVADVLRLLSRARLVTLTGPPGIGKSRLATEAATCAVTAFPDGVTFVALASLRDPTLIATAIAAALGVRDTSGRPLRDALVEALQSRQTLLVIDNFEHVIVGAPLLSDLLASCPKLRLLVTSREALQVNGEQLYPVPPLGLPQRGQSPPVEHLARFSAVQLFTERAAAIAPQFRVDESNADTVTEICHQLDGLPLAIEMAASRIRILTPEAILERLGRRFSVLERRTRDAPERHQTMRSAIDWSYELLAIEEQSLLQQLSVFAGGWALAALDAVCQVTEVHPSDARSEQLSVRHATAQSRTLLPLLESLVVKSLVWQQTDHGEPRFTMLESIREYAAERLEASGMTAQLCQRHATYYAQVADHEDRHATGPPFTRWLDRVERDQGNVRATLQWFIEQEAADEALGMGSALCEFWARRGDLAEGRERLDAILAIADAQSATRARAEALIAAASLSCYMGDIAGERAFAKQAEAIWRRLGDRQGVASVLNRLGLTSRELGDYASARALLEESLVMLQELGNRGEMAVVLDRIGHTALFQGDHETAWSYLQQSLAIRRELENTLGVAYALHNLGLVARDRGDYADAHQLFSDALELQRGADFKYGIVETTCSLGALALDACDLAVARTRFTESITAGRAFGSLEMADFQLEGFAGIAAIDGCPERCLRLASAANAWRTAHQRVLHPTCFPKRDAWLSKARHALGPEAAHAAEAAGRAMSLEQALAEALETNG